MGEFLNFRNALYTHLTTCGPYGTGEVSACDAGILEGVSGCAILLYPGPSEFIPLRFGTRPAREYERTWGARAILYIKDNGDPTGFNSRLWQGVDDIYTTVQKDGTLNGAVDDFIVDNIAPRGEGFDAQGVNWGIIEIALKAQGIT